MYGAESSLDRLVLDTHFGLGCVPCVIHSSTGIRCRIGPPSMARRRSNIDQCVTWGVKRIGFRLLQQAGVDELAMEWSFGVAHAPMVNAFCFPGGVMRVTDSLLYKLDLTEGEIAALLGLEIGHVLNRHSQRRIIQQNLVKLVIDALVYDDQDGDDESFGQAVGELMLKSATYLGSLSFSRKDEYEADATSWELLVASGIYQPHALQSMLSTLWSYDGSSGDTSWESTHPGTRDRIAALQVKWDLLSTREQKRLAHYPIP